MAKKDFNAPKHPSIEGVPNLQVINVLKVCNSNPRGYLILTECKVYYAQALYLISTSMCHGVNNHIINKRPRGLNADAV